MPFYWLILGILAVWRTTHFLHAEDGPMDVSAQVRRLAGRGMAGRILDCFYCLSIWIAAPVAFWIGTGVREIVCLGLAFSAGAILLERLTVHEERMPLPIYFEHGTEKKEDELLREKTGNVA